MSKKTPAQKVIAILRQEVELTLTRAQLIHDTFEVRAKVAQSIFDRRQRLGIQASLDAITGGRCSKMQCSWLREQIDKIASEYLAAAA
ncbi:MAG: hypothetical protein WBB39_02550 [Candidatus Saccharimonadales bacterium]